MPLLTPRSLAFRAFSCESFDDGSSYLRADYSVSCKDEAVYGEVQRLAWAGIILFPVCVPLTYAALLYRARDAIMSSRQTTLTRALDFLHRDLEPRCYLWEVRRGDAVARLV